MRAVASTTRQVTCYAFPTGLEGTLTVQIDQDETTVYGPTTATIEEYPAGSGIYNAEVVIPATAGTDYRIVFHNPDADGPSSYSVEDLEVVASEAETASPELPAPSLTGRVCTAWATADEVVACGYGESLGSEAETVLEPYIVAATELLWLLSGRKFSSGCEVTVRPCEESHGPFMYQRIGGATIVWAGDVWQFGAGPRARFCDCCGVDAIKLAGSPVREILNVKIDGVAVETDGYRLDRGRWLVRLADEDGNRQRWPTCQRLDRADTEDGTFSVTYTYGADPPMWGRLAVAAMAGEAYAQCGNNGDECRLPAGVTSETRQGVTIQYGLVAEWLAAGKTGIQAIDYFAAGWINPKHPRRRRAAVWTPEMRPYARPVGSGGS